MSLRTDRLEAARLEQLVRASEWFMGVLDAARACGAPDCWVGAGAQRDLVWDQLHGGFVPERVKDVDVAFFDPQDLRPERDQAVEDELVQLLPGVRWDAKNQAAVHPWYERRFGVPVQPLGSTADGVATWPETATAVALQLRRDGRLAILAPCGLSDLLHGVAGATPPRERGGIPPTGQRQADRPAMAARSRHRPGRRASTRKQTPRLIGGLLPASLSWCETYIAHQKPRHS